MSEFKFELSDKVKDIITGFTGIIIAKTKWVNGCVRYTVQAQKLKDGNVTELCLDEGQIVKIGHLNGINEVPTGGPKPSPRLPKNPTRR